MFLLEASRHFLQRQSGYWDFKVARVSSLNLTSEHQQPASVAPQENLSPQAAQVDGSRQRGEMTAANLLSLLAIKSFELTDCRFLLRRASLAASRCGAHPPPKLQRQDHERLGALPPEAPFPIRL
jgi:hypothetical protein